MHSETGYNRTGRNLALSLRRQPVDWFNNRRLLKPIGHIPPAEAEQRYHAELATGHAAA